MFSNLISKKFVLILGSLVLGVSIACGSGSVDEPVAAPPSTSEPVAAPTSTPEPVAVIDEVAHIDGDDHAVEVHADLAVEHDADEHVVLDEDEHVAEETETEGHGHGVGAVDADAPVLHVFATEFGYEPIDLSVDADQPFTIMLHNEGVLEHDITIEGFEEQGGIHLLAKEDGMATFSLPEPGEYTVYCTVPGHRDAGMESTLTVTPHEDDGQPDEPSA